MTSSKNDPTHIHILSDFDYVDVYVSGNMKTYCIIEQLIAKEIKCKNIKPGVLYALQSCQQLISLPGKIFDEDQTIFLLDPPQRIEKNLLSMGSTFSP
jgi:hypothetical protein